MPKACEVLLNVASSQVPVSRHPSGARFFTVFGEPLDETYCSGEMMMKLRSCKSLNVIRACSHSWSGPDDSHFLVAGRGATSGSGRPPSAPNTILSNQSSCSAENWQTPPKRHSKNTNGIFKLFSDSRNTALTRVKISRSVLSGSSELGLNFSTRVTSLP
jgi:hypothetical protein